MSHIPVHDYHFYFLLIYGIVYLYLYFCISIFCISLLNIKWVANTKISYASLECIKTMDVKYILRLTYL